MLKKTIVILLGKILSFSSHIKLSILQKLIKPKPKKGNNNTQIELEDIKALYDIDVIKMRMDVLKNELGRKLDEEIRQYTDPKK